MQPVLYIEITIFYYYIYVYNINSLEFSFVKNKKLSSYRKGNVKKKTRKYIQLNAINIILLFIIIYNYTKTDYI